jgi:hypothetical protein
MSTHLTAPTQFVEANGLRFAYPRFGKPPQEEADARFGRSAGDPDSRC